MQMATTIVEAGIDYLTLHTPEWGEYRPLQIDTLMQAYIALHETPIQLQYMRTKGYEGYGDDYFFVGSREDGYLREIKSSAADYLYAMVVIESDNPSRIDAQVTIRYESEPVAKIDAHAQEAEVFNSSLHEKKQRVLQNVSDSKQGRSLYIGSRDSDVFGRIYHKWAKSREEKYIGCVRYEIQFKDGYADAITRTMPMERYQRAIYIAQLVRRWFLDRGVIVPIDTRGGNTRVPRPELPKTNVDSTMAWLKTQVNPAVKRLLQSVPKQHILIALGLDEPVPPMEPPTEAKE